MTSGQGSSRTSSGHRAPLLNGAGDHSKHRTFTPTKQVSLVTVKRKNDSRCTETFSDDLEKGDSVTSLLSQSEVSSMPSPVSSTVTGANDATSSGTVQKRQSKRYFM
ncbi:hypothetical protein NP493_257g01039 [Ridgeia piscesae]|uniref:Uncharacterized protein n=1 Tax=Ridgeia piscesae TaxID=27915 RepID=A0AAD9UCV1_RIDPI|nr:hypothetical protein NP493_257g01039 [Ridgeia piscesae]